MRTPAGHQSVVEQQMLVVTERYFHRYRGQLSGRVSINGVLSSFTDFSLQIIAQMFFYRLQEDVIEPAGTAAETDLQAVDVASTSGAADGRLACWRRTERH